ncbi:hypothetical protein TUBRATIS_005180 [Tubulinosema ratisbonensis]|uniref:Uncharacterized protein n=1 Tax=Tubulinosema ratisbonensis TaxID=291195 RepID=A0A437APL8_9MICR|nr:hypothetical protein TUBRATIS_005180 [Tubulinosema ratisbonensis]
MIYYLFFTKLKCACKYEDQETSLDCTSKEQVNQKEEDCVSVCKEPFELRDDLSKNEKPIASPITDGKNPKLSQMSYQDQAAFRDCTAEECYEKVEKMYRPEIISLQGCTPIELRKIIKDLKKELKPEAKIFSGFVRPPLVPLTAKYIKDQRKKSKNAVKRSQMWMITCTIFHNFTKDEANACLFVIYTSFMSNLFEKFTRDSVESKKCILTIEGQDCCFNKKNIVDATDKWKKQDFKFSTLKEAKTCLENAATIFNPKWDKEVSDYTKLKFELRMLEGLRYFFL